MPRVFLYRARKHLWILCSVHAGLLHIQPQHYAGSNCAHAHAQDMGRHSSRGCRNDAESDKQLLVPPHPLDWAAYLRHSLVFEPVPAFLTLLLLAAHYHASCTTLSSVGGHADGQSTFQKPVVNESSATGYLFASISLSLSGFARGGLWCIETPLHHAAVRGFGRCTHEETVEQPGGSPSRGRVRSGNADQDGNAPPHPDENAPAADDEPPFTLTPEGILRVSMKDPFTIAYGAWSYLSAQREQPDNHERQQMKGSDARGAGSSSDEDERSRRSCAWNGEGSSGVAEDGLQSTWIHICVVHAIGAAGVAFALIPSIFARSSLLACNKVSVLLACSVSKIQTR